MNSQQIETIQKGLQVITTALDPVKTIGDPSWDKLVAAVNEGQAVIVDRPVVQTGDTHLMHLGGCLVFHGEGLIRTMGRDLRIDCPTYNVGQRQVFYDYEINEAYPYRWNNHGRNIWGTFGGNSQRHPVDWGLRPEWHETPAQAHVNNDAIAAAALSAHYQNGAPCSALQVVLPASNFFIRRTVRLDGLRCQLVGQGRGATRLMATRDFDTSHHFITRDFPGGTAPLVEIGYEMQPGVRNPDQGFFSGVRGVGLVGLETASLGERPISGIMWGNALQEGSRVEDVSVSGFSGYGVGGYRWQRNKHNGAPRNWYPQFNMVRFQGLWLMEPMRPDAIGMKVYGGNFHIDDVTLSHFRTDGVSHGGMTAPAIVTGSTQAGRWSNIHIEQAPRGSTMGIGIYCPGDSKAHRMSFEGINYHPTKPSLGGSTTFRTLKLDGLGAYSCRMIANAAPPTLYGGGACIEDGLTGKVSKGYHGSEANGQAVASYDRQMTDGVAEVASSDPSMLL